MNKKINISIFISGRGSNMVALVEALQTHPKANLCCIIVDNYQAKGITKAQEFGLPTHVVERSKYANKTDFEQKIMCHLKNYHIHLILLAGFMQLLSADFIQHYPHVLNIHPSLLPKYPGLNTHQRALDDNERQVGATVHWVNEEMDAGKIIDQCKIDVEVNDTAYSLAERLLPKEHQLYKDVIFNVLEDYNL